MFSVDLRSEYADPIWLRQTPLGDGVWENAQFTISRTQSDAAEDPDWLVVLHRSREPIQTRVPKDRRIVVLTEPPEIFPYTSGYLAQFGVVLSMRPRVAPKGTEVIAAQVGMPWLYGLEGGLSDWAAIDDAPGAPKTKVMSVICSNKARTPTQMRRLRFVEKLDKAFNGRIDLYGRGVKPFEDKREVLDPYFRHIVLENNLDSHGWTEKLADALLAECQPIHGGGVDLGAYFPAGSFERIDLRKPTKSLDVIARLLDSPPPSREAVRRAKTRLMTRWNLFAVIAEIINSNATRRDAPGLAKPQTVHPAPKRSLERLARNVAPMGVRRLGWRIWQEFTEP